MGLVTGGLNGRRFRTTTTLPDGFRDRYLEAVREHAFVPVPDAADNEPRFGWVDVFEPANTAFELNTFLYDSFVCLSLRIDKKAVNGAYRKIALAERTARVLEMRGVEKLSKAERAELEEALDSELFARALPSVGTVDVAWSTLTGEVVVFGTSDTTLELVQAHFEATFDVRLRPERMVDWLGEKLPWEEIGTRVDAHLPDARGSKGLGEPIDGWHEDDPLDGARFQVAADFITWLWLQSEASDGFFRVIEGGAAPRASSGDDDDWDDLTETLKHADLTLWLESKLKLQDVEVAETPDTTILLGVAPSVTPAARRDLHAGKRPVEARLGMKLDELECGLTLVATDEGVAVTGLKLPFEVKSGQEEKIFERMGLLDLMHGTLKKLFQQFFLARTSPAWDERVEAWLSEDLAAK